MITEHIMNVGDRTSRIVRLLTVPLLCPIGLIALILAHILLAVGEVVLALTHHDLAYLVLFTGDILALLLICLKAYRRTKRPKAKPKPAVIAPKHRAAKGPRHRQCAANPGSPTVRFDEQNARMKHSGLRDAQADCGDEQTL